MLNNLSLWNKFVRFGLVSLRSGANDATRATKKLYTLQKSCDCPILFHFTRKDAPLPHAYFSTFQAGMWTTSERSEQVETSPQPGTSLFRAFDEIACNRFLFRALKLCLVKWEMGEKTNNIDVKIFSVESWKYHLFFKKVPCCDFSLYRPAITKIAYNFAF